MRHFLTSFHPKWHRLALLGKFWNLWLSMVMAIPFGRPRHSLCVIFCHFSDDIRYFFDISLSEIFALFRHFLHSIGIFLYLSGIFWHKLTFFICGGRDTEFWNYMVFFDDNCQLLAFFGIISIQKWLQNGISRHRTALHCNVSQTLVSRVLAGIKTWIRRLAHFGIHRHSLAIINFQLKNSEFWQFLAIFVRLWHGTTTIGMTWQVSKLMSLDGDGNVIGQALAFWDLSLHHWALYVIFWHFLDDIRHFLDDRFFFGRGQQN